MTFYVAVHPNETRLFAVHGTYMVSREATTLYEAAAQLRRRGVIEAYTPDTRIVQAVPLRCPSGTPFLPVNADVGFVHSVQFQRSEVYNGWEFIPLAYLGRDHREYVERHRRDRRNLLMLDPPLSGLETVIQARCDSMETEVPTFDLLGAAAIAPSTARQAPKHKTPTTLPRALQPGKVSDYRARLVRRRTGD